MPFFRLKSYKTAKKAARNFDKLLSAFLRGNMAKPFDDLTIVDDYMFYRVSVLDKNQPYEALSDSFIIFFCTFDYLAQGLPVYTFKTVCTENTNIQLADGITKIILNSKAAEKETSPALKSFLQYMNGKVSNDSFIRKIEQRIKEVKESEELRREYMLINSFERDARHEGWKEGVAQGFSDGSHQAKLETAAAFKRFGFDIDKIAEGTGLSREEIEKL